MFRFIYQCIVKISLLLLSTCSLFAQDSSVTKKIPLRFVAEASKKMEKYNNRTYYKTKNTLEKLAQWEIKIKHTLEKVDPHQVSILFNNEKNTFSRILEKFQSAHSFTTNSTAKYNEYRDKLVTNLKYIKVNDTLLSHKGILKTSGYIINSIDSLEKNIKISEEVEILIKQRKKELLTSLSSILLKNKYLFKINKEIFYFQETLKNYKDIFSTPNKTEKIAFEILSKIPEAKDFFQRNSQISFLFGGFRPVTNTNSLVGLQTISQVQNLIQQQFAGQQMTATYISSTLQEARRNLNLRHNKLQHTQIQNSDEELPDFKNPNMQRTKTLKQRLEFGTNFQLIKTTTYNVRSINIGLTVGYKLNDKSIVGVGVAYNLDFIIKNKIRLNSKGGAIRSFVDYKLKKQIFISGGYELNYNNGFTKIPNFSDLSQSGLIGITKKLNVQHSLLKGTKVQLFYDFLHNSNKNFSQPIVVRIGYTF